MLSLFRPSFKVVKEGRIWNNIKHLQKVSFFTPGFGQYLGVEQQNMIKTGSFYTKCEIKPFEKMDTITSDDRQEKNNR